MDSKTISEFFLKDLEVLPLFESFSAWIGRWFPTAVVVVQKTQIAIGNPRPFCWFWLPIRSGIPHRPAHYGVVSFGLPERITDPRIVESTEARPGFWTHHVLFSRLEDADAGLLAWLKAADAWRNP